MLNRKGLFNPIKKGNGIPDQMFQKYIKIWEEQNRLLLTDPALTAEVQQRFYESHPKVDRAHLDKIWNFMSPMIQKNEALAQFVLDNGGAESSYFFPWVMSVASSPSEALELSYNAGRNLMGEWVSNIPEDDNINFFVQNLPTLAYNRERQLRVANLVTSDRNTTISNEKSVVVDLGAGRMAWARHHGFQSNPMRQRVFACDKDPSIQPYELFPCNAFWNSSLTYEHKDIMEELKNPSCADASLVILQGVASYYPMSLFTEAIVKPVYTLLRSGGSFFFDLQLDHISYEWSVKVFGWPEMKLPKTASDAINAVEVMRKILWHKGQEFSADYALDTYNASPLSVMVLLTKI
ncbi:class I SAM-dependent methyltransferase [Candidatus Saccharibacteria bacterium]|nr:class I SAM-dependent methyltransferase [Candidatus Saccharibacteria bacterium]